MGKLGLKIPDKFDLQTADVNFLVQVLRTEGVLVLTNTLMCTPELEQDYKKLAHSVKHQHGNYEFGSAGNFVPGKGEFPAIDEWVKHEKIRAIIEAYNGASKCIGVMATHETVVTDKWPRNAYLHYDRDRTVKCAMYLSDITEDDAPTHFIAGSTKHAKAVRENELARGKTVRDMRCQLREIPELQEIGYETSLATPILGEKGTAIIFDTDTLHLGGILKKKGRERKIIRSHWKRA